jgi:hypothetical protein
MGFEIAMPFRVSANYPVEQFQPVLTSISNEDINLAEVLHNFGNCFRDLGRVGNFIWRLNL